MYFGLYSKKKYTDARTANLANFKLKNRTVYLSIDYTSSSLTGKVCYKMFLSIDPSGLRK